VNRTAGAGVISDGRQALRPFFIEKEKIMSIPLGMKQLAVLGLLLAALAACADPGSAGSSPSVALSSDFPGLSPLPQQNFPRSSHHSGG
jgi:hypothetical protein